MRVLVTGAAGFIGFHVARRLALAGHEVLGLDNLNAYYDPALKRARLAALGISSADLAAGGEVQSWTWPKLRFTLLDLAHKEPLLACMARGGFTGVVHLAAQAGVRHSLQDPDSYLSSNLLGFGHLLEGCRHHGVGHLVFASSSSVYGLNQKVPFSIHDPVDHAISLYAASKKANELMAHSYAQLFGLACTGLRFFTVYGSWGRPDMALYRFTDCLYRGAPVPLYAGGRMERDFTHVDDVADCVLRVLARPAAADPGFDPRHPDPASSSAPYRIYNVGGDHPVEVRHLLRLLEHALGASATVDDLPAQPGDVPRTWADIAETTRDFGWQPRIRFEDGVLDFVEWFRAYHEKQRQGQ